MMPFFDYHALPLFGKGQPQQFSRLQNVCERGDNILKTVARTYFSHERARNRRKWGLRDLMTTERRLGIWGDIKRCILEMSGSRTSDFSRLRSC